MAAFHGNLSSLRAPLTLMGALVLGVTVAVIADPFSRRGSPPSASMTQSSKPAGGEFSIAEPAAFEAPERREERLFQSGPASAPKITAPSLQDWLANLEPLDASGEARLMAAYRERIGDTHSMQERVDILNAIGKLSDKMRAERLVLTLASEETQSADGLIAIAAAGDVLGAFWSESKDRIEAHRGALYGSAPDAEKLAILVGMANASASDMGPDLSTLALGGESALLRANAILTMGRAADRQSVLSLTEVILARPLDGDSAHMDLVNAVRALVTAADREPNLGPIALARITDRIVRADMNLVAFQSCFDELVKLNRSAAEEFAAAPHPLEGAKKAYMADVLLATK